MNVSRLITPFYPITTLTESLTCWAVGEVERLTISSICFSSFFCHPMTGEGTLYRTFVADGFSADEGTDLELGLRLVDFLFENM